MQYKLESNTSRAVKRKRRIAIYIAGLTVLLAIVATVTLKTASEAREPPSIVIRIDDIQDFAFREAQVFLLKESMTNEIPLSLAVIAGMFGEDREIVQSVKLAVSAGSEIAVHGWKHEDIDGLSFREQVALLSQSRRHIKEILDFTTKVVVPPRFGFSENTIAAMREEGYKIISTITDYTEPGLISEVISLPATIELSDFSNNIWTMKTPDSIHTEVSKSIGKYGFAVIVTHPQEFMLDGKLDQASTELYRNLLVTLKREYSFVTLETLGKNWQR